AIAIVKAAVDGLLALAANIRELLDNLGEVEVPILSALYRSLTGKPLTFVDLVSFVVAIPVTHIYRVVGGRWRSEAGVADAADVGASSVRLMAGVTAGVLNVVAGVVTAILDTCAMADASRSTVLQLLAKITGGVLLLLQAAKDVYTFTAEAT